MYWDTALRHLYECFAAWWSEQMERTVEEAVPPSSYEPILSIRIPSDFIQEGDVVRTCYEVHDGHANVSVYAERREKD